MRALISTAKLLKKQLVHYLQLLPRQGDSVEIQGLSLQESNTSS